MIFLATKTEDHQLTEMVTSNGLNSRVNAILLLTQQLLLFCSAPKSDKMYMLELSLLVNQTIRQNFANNCVYLTLVQLP